MWKLAAGNLARRVFAHPRLYTLNHLLLHLSLRGLGFNNWGSLATTGEQFLLRHIGSSLGVAVDVGAHKGGYTEALLQASEATVYAIEPSPIAYGTLVSRFKGSPRVRCFQVALSRMPGIATLHDYASGTGSEHASLDASAFQILHHSPTVGMTVSVTTLDALVETEGLDRIDLLKIDVEGLEPEVLEGSRRTIEHLRPSYIQIEFNQHALLRGVTVRAIAELLPGYDLYRLLPRGRVLINPLRYEHNIFAYHTLLAVPRTDSGRRNGGEATGL